MSSSYPRDMDKHRSNLLWGRAMNANQGVGQLIEVKKIKRFYIF